MKRNARHAVKCAYCNRLAFAPQYISPPMCRKHHELALVVSRLQRQGQAVTMETIEASYRRRLARRVVAPEEVAGLLRGMLKG